MNLKTMMVVYCVVWGLLASYWGWQGLVTLPSEGDSLAYHLPLAENLKQGKVTDFEVVSPAPTRHQLVTLLLQYYPAASHVVLAGFVTMGVPQLFNVVGWVVLSGVCWWLARQSGLSSPVAVFYAVCVVTLTSVVRLVLTQTIDIWLAVWYGVTLGLLLKPVATTKYWLALALALGMLIGTKYTGPLFVLGLGGWWLSRWSLHPRKPTYRQFCLMLMILVITGGSWYLRNLWSHGDAFYPASHPLFTLDETHNWQTWWYQPESRGYLIQSLVSEYQIWSLSLLLVPVYLLIHIKNHLPRSVVTDVGWLGLFNALVHVMLPASPANLLSDLRYAFPTFMCLMLVVWWWAVDKKLTWELAVVSLISVVSPLTVVVAHRPKFLVAYSLVVAIGLYYYRVYQTQKHPSR